MSHPFYQISKSTNQIPCKVSVTCQGYEWKSMSKYCVLLCFVRFYQVHYSNIFFYCLIRGRQSPDLFLLQLQFAAEKIGPDKKEMKRKNKVLILFLLTIHPRFLLTIHHKFPLTIHHRFLLTIHPRFHQWTFKRNMLENWNHTFTGRIFC